MNLYRRGLRNGVLVNPKLFILEKLNLAPHTNAWSNLVKRVKNLYYLVRVVTGPVPDTGPNGDDEDNADEERNDEYAEDVDDECDGDDGDVEVDEHASFFRTFNQVLENE